MYQKLRVSLAEAEAQVAGLRSQLGTHQAQLDQIRASASQRPQVEAELAQLNRDYEVMRKNYDALVARRESASIGAKLGETSGYADFRVVEPARVSTSAAFPNRLHLALLSIVVTLAAGVGAALLVENLRPAVDAVDALAALSGRPVLGAVSMVVTPLEVRARRMGAMRFGLACALLLVVQSIWVAWVAMNPRISSEGASMSIVEQAARRLEQLRNAGIAVPDLGAGAITAAPQRCVRGQGRRRSPRPRPRCAGWPNCRRLRHERRDRRWSSRHVPAAPPAVPKDIASEAPVAAPSPTQAANRPRVPAMATLDLAKLQQAGYLVPASTRTLLAEELRHVKRPLLKNARDAEPGAARMAQIMVTSALPGEGKTFFSINLAISMAAEIDRSVLLIDADVIHPTLFQRIGVEPGRGLLDVLMNPDLDVMDVVLDTNVPKLSLLSAGTRNDRATELLASDSMEALLARLEQCYPEHIIIFDASPLLVTNEAKVLATRVGQVVMIVEAAKTPRSVVAQAYASLEHCPVVLSVLNKLPETHAPMGYGYYYP